MKRYVGFIFFEALLAPIFDPQEPVLSELLNVNGSDERQVRAVIRRYVKPYYDSFDDRSRAVMADSILYFATAKDLPETPPLDALPTPFEMRQSVRELCEWIESELTIDSGSFALGECEYTDNLSLVHRLRRAVRH